MQNLIQAVRQGLVNKNYFASLFTALSIPDVCVALEFGQTSGKKYASWWEKYMTSYTGFISGNDTYALRCAALHNGQANIIQQPIREVLEDIVFMTSGAHCNLFRDCFFKGEKKTFLQLNVVTFCEDICLSAEKWSEDNGNNQEAIDRMEKELTIHDPGYIHLGCVKFG